MAHKKAGGSTVTVAIQMPNAGALNCMLDKLLNQAASLCVRLVILFMLG